VWDEICDDAAGDEEGDVVICRVDVHNLFTRQAFIVVWIPSHAGGLEVIEAIWAERVECEHVETKMQESLVRN
jgi:hypothetical protein